MAGRGVGSGLRDLARAHGIQLWHRDGFGVRRQPGEDALLAILGSLGADIERASQAGEAIKRRQSELAGRVVEPVQVSWSNVAPVFRLSLPAATGSRPLRLSLLGESGHIWEASAQSRDLAVAGGREVDGRRIEDRFWPLPADLPDDVYACMLELDGEPHESTLLRAPVKAASLSGPASGRPLALFLPAYAIKTDRTWGMGDYTALGDMVRLASETGAGSVATLPLSPVFEDDPSPYSPVSRLFWNELYVDPREAPEFASCDEAVRLVESGKFRSSVAALERSELVDYSEQFRLRRPVLQALADHAARSPQLREKLDLFAATRPFADSYATFRAACEKLGRPWRGWPVTRSADLRPGEHFDPASYTYHLNAQRLAFEQVERLAAPAGDDSPVLYLDMPLGVRGDGFDTWLKPGLFAQDASAGAPPDAFFSSGQIWGFPPMRPDALREDGYRYFRDSIRRFGGIAGIVRIDHVMSMHRLYWVPPGMDARDGAYVRYPAEEMYAAVTLESQRSGSAVVGEDLGAVPGYVGPAMRRHSFYRMYATYFNIRTGEKSSVAGPGADMFAYVNTHDMPAFAAFVSGADIDDRRERGLFSEAEAEVEKASRERAIAALSDRLRRDGMLASGASATEDLLRALVAWLRRSDAVMTVINLEDLWLEERPQNTPGTSTERPNWRGRAKLSIAEIKGLLERLS